MPDNIERTIYKLEIDDSSYIKGVENLSASTNKLTAAQEKANEALKGNEAALKAQSEFLQKTKKDLDAYTGTNEQYRKQLEKSFKDAQADNIKLTQLVNDNRKAYDAAAQSAQNFANTSAKATQLQQNTTGGKIPTAPPPSLAAGLSQQIVSTLNIPEFAAQAEIIAQTKEEFDGLATAITLAEERMKQLNSTDEEFKLLAPIVAQGKVALQQYDDSVKKAGGSTISLRQQILNGNNALAQLQDAGKGASKEYVELEKHVAHLSELYRQQRERIAVLSSETRALDFGKAAVQSAIAGFEVYTSVSILAGGASEELQKKTMQLFAAMQLLNAMEHLVEQTKRGSILATNIQSAAQSVYTAVVGASTGALKAFRVALLGTGILGAAVLIGFLVKKYIDYKNALDEAGREAKDLKEINDKAIDGYSAEVTKLTLVKAKLDDLSIPQKQRIALAKDYNKQAEEGNKIDLKQIDNIDLLNAAIDRQIEKIKARALATAAEQFVTEKASEFFKQQANIISKFPDLPVDDKTLEKLIADRKKGLLDLNQFTIKQREQFIAAFVSGDINAFVKARDEFNRAAQISNKLIDPTALVTPIVKTDTKEIENVFAQKLKELQARLADVTAKSFESEGTIRKQFQASLDKEIQSIKDTKGLTPDQRVILIDLLVRINEVQLQEALKNFNKKVTDARQKLTDELNGLQEKATQDSINLWKDEFDRRAALIEFNEKKEIADAKEATQNRLDALEFERLLIGEKAYQEARSTIIATGEQNALNIISRFAKERQDLSADIFKKGLEFFQTVTSEIDLAGDEKTAKQVRDLSNKFLVGKISFKQFQDDITKIQKDADSKRRDSTLLIQRAELRDLDFHIGNIKDKTSQEYKDLIKLRQDLRNKIAAGEKEDAIKDAEAPTTDPRIERIVKYAEAIGQVIGSVVQFWQAANEAESKALDRSITLQEKRVEAAQRIAERGNAQYLKQEEDRLRELNLKRENAARRDLAINAALQASQILVGITGAIAKIASGIGAAETIAEIAIIIGALATGYGLVKSLQGNQPKLAEGTTYVSRGRNRPGKDTIPAWLNEGEAVTSAEKNRAYHPTVKAIHEGSVPAEHLNNFVKTYHRVKGVPQPDYGRIKDAAELKIGQDGKLSVALNEQNRLITENNDLQRQTIRALKSMGVNVNMDKNGFAMSIMEVAEQIKIDKRV